MPSEKVSISSLLENELSAHGRVRAPWDVLPGVHPFDLAWRMGHGEGHLLLWGRWLGALAPAEAWSRALLALKQSAPIPADWAYWALEATGLSTEDDAYDHSFEDARKRLSEVGLEVAGEPSDTK